MQCKQWLRKFEGFSMEKERKEARLHDKHISLDVVSDVRDICKPLFQKTDINYFHYGRVYPDGRSLVLISDGKFHKHFWEMEYDRTIFPLYQEGIIINEPGSHQALIDAREYFNVDHWLIIVKEKSDYMESYGFGTYSDNNKIVEYYLGHQSELCQFGLYFKEKSKNLIDRSKTSMLYTDEINLHCDDKRGGERRIRHVFT